MAITPDTNIKLLKCPLTLDNKNQLTFVNASAQYNYFNSLPKIEIDNCQYQRKDSIIRYPAHIDSIIEYNYLLYQNENYTNKWFYAYITNMRYVNDNMTEITIATDVWQTWQFDVIYKNSFIEREHTNNDTYGANTIDEGLGLGELICNKKNSLFRSLIDSTYTGMDLAIVVGVAEKLSSSPSDLNHGDQINGIYGGLRYYAFKNNTFLEDSNNNILALDNFISDYDSAGKGSAIYCIFMYPSQFVNSAFSQPDHHIASTNEVNSLYINIGETSLNKNIDFTQNNLDGYVPKNRKVLCYPFNYLLVSNNNGSNVIYKLEEFYTKNDNVKTIINPQFEINACLTPRWKY